MRIGSRSFEVDWGCLGVATLIAGTSLAYLLDARATSLNIQNLLLVQPTALLVLALYLLVLPQCFRGMRSQPETADVAARPVRSDRSRQGVSRVVLALAFGLFIVSVETVGYDVGAYLFTLAGLWTCGERRPLALLLFPPLFTAVVILGFKAMVPYPMPTLLL